MAASMLPWLSTLVVEGGDIHICHANIIHVHIFILISEKKMDILRFSMNNL